jgi:hypothetical protein
MRIIRILMVTESASKAMMYSNQLTWLSAKEEVLETLEILTKALKPTQFSSLERCSQKFM